MSRGMLGVRRCFTGWRVALLMLVPSPVGILASAQRPRAATGTMITGRVVDAEGARIIPGATITIEGLAIRAVADSAGRFTLRGVPPGPQVLRAVRLAFAPTRVTLLVPAAGELSTTVTLARNALSLRGIVVTADPASRARGELGTASVIEGDALRNISATSLATILELLPGVPLQPPGLDGVQQASLRSVPISPGSVTGPNASGPSAANLAAFGTQIILDGVPVSNNANLQSFGVRAELSLATAAGGGVDLRRFPASTIDRVEVIRGIPSARFGDLTNGAILIDTRAGAMTPELVVRYDPRTVEVNLVGGRTVGGAQTLSLVGNVSRKQLAPGVRRDEGNRISLQAAHRLTAMGRGVPSHAADPRLVLDTRADFFQVLEDVPPAEDAPEVISQSRDAGFRLSERLRLAMGGGQVLSVTAALEGIQQRSFSQAPRLRGAMPFTNRTTPGRSVGKFIAGPYLARVDVDGEPRHFYSRIEHAAPMRRLGMEHLVRSGVELRREWTGGPGYQFDIEFPPQSEFNGVQGFDRPRRYDAVPPLLTSALYLDDRMTRSFGSWVLQLQGGVRVDAMHEGSSWFSGARDAVVQPRLNVELSPVRSLRLRLGAGRVGKVPSIADLSPAPQFNDVVNVNWYANDPAERLAVLTTYIFDPSNPSLGYSIADKLEAGFEVDFGARGDLAVVVFSDRTTNAVGIRAEPTFLLRERFRLADTVPGTGRPSRVLEPAIARDSVPILIDRRANNLTLRGSGVELTATLPELAPLRTRIAVQGAWVTSKLENADVEFANNFSAFQLNERIPRSPYWEGNTRLGERVLVTTRLIHHQPDAGLVITGTVQHTLREIRDDLGGNDTLAFAGYVTRAGRLIPVPNVDRGQAQYRDLRVVGRSILPETQRGPSDWLFSLQVSKTLPLGGRLSFYAFNTFDRVGNYGGRTITPRLYPSTRFGADLTLPLLPVPR